MFFRFQRLYDRSTSDQVVYSEAPQTVGFEPGANELKSRTVQPLGHTASTISNGVNEAIHRPSKWSICLLVATWQCGYMKKTNSLFTSFASLASLM